MKIWTELDMEPIIKKIDDEIQHPYGKGARTMELMIHLYHEIEKNARESGDLSIYGYRIEDLVPLAWALRTKGVQAKEIEDWSSELRQMQETMQTAMSADLTDKIRAAVHELAVLDE